VETRKVLIGGAVGLLIIVACSGGVIYMNDYCDKNPQAAACQEQDISDDGYDGADTSPEDCDGDDSVAKGDMECVGIPGKEGTVTSTRKPTTTSTKGNTCTKTGTTTNKKFK
jgi:hypothetical protein